MNIANCKMCGSVPYEHEFVNSCAHECYCGVRGPSRLTRKESATAWNALMCEPAEPAAGSVRVTAYAIISTSGDWAINGWRGAEKDKIGNVLFDMISDFGENTLVHPVTFDIPLPQSAEITGRVE